jgi:hypothetical protein
MSAVRAELRARELMRAVVRARDYGMYAELGFVSVAGGSGGPYAYLVYPHRPLLAYETGSGRLLSEYCVRFRDGGERLPDADDVLARWLAIRGRERELIETANMNRPGHQIDPDHARRDLRRMREWVDRNGDVD